MEIAIWGMGAVGIGLASSLAEPDSPLLLFGRDPETLQALRLHGIRRTGLFGEANIPVHQLRIESDPSLLEKKPPDWLLICVKAFSSEQIAMTLEPLAGSLGTKTNIVLCQNGWGNEAAFLPFWSSERLFHARVITGFHRHRLHEVQITAHAAPIALGSLFGGSTLCLAPLAERLTRGGIAAETRPDMESVLWAKMLYNCALNPLGALTNRRYGQLAEVEATRELMRQVVEEIFEVLDRAGIRMPWPTAGAYLKTFYTDLIPPTAAHESSMLQDLRAGRRTEIEALCGSVERLGAKHCVATPVISSLADLVRSAESR